ncbi:hypothetical protein EB118_00420 [bacterium]|nr:hypothetical protein [bacterium]
MTSINIDNSSLDLSQNITNNTAVDLSLQNPIYSGGQVNDINSNTSIVSPNGLNFNIELSNANLSSQYAITDFTIFNPYIHNTSFYTFSTSNLLQVATNRFNIYSQSFRTWLS